MHRNKLLKFSDLAYRVVIYWTSDVATGRDGSPLPIAVDGGHHGDDERDSSD
jgi:hypothetical protein